MMRVLHVIDSLGNGGAEYQLTAMLIRSDAQRFQHSVCALGKADRYGARLREAGIPVYKFNRDPRHEPLRILRELRRVVREVAPDVMHVSLYWASVLGRTAARLARIPVVTSLVTTTYEPEWRQGNPQLTPLKVMGAWTLDVVTARRWGTWFVAVTEAVRNSAVQQLGLPPERITVIPRGLEMDRFIPPPPQTVTAFRAHLEWDGAYPLLLNVGRLVSLKGQRYAIEAMPEILKTFPRALLVLVGEGYERGDIEALARSLGVAERVQLLGERHDVPILLASADIFVFPSLYEGFGGALVEALGAGCPCVASRIPHLREVTDAGRVALLVEPRSPRPIAEAVIRLAGDLALAARLGDEGAAWARERYDITSSIRKFEAVFDAVASGRPVRTEELTVAAR